eukprot:scpid96298/ scgid21436/ 
MKLLLHTVPAMYAVSAQMRASGQLTNCYKCLYRSQRKKKKSVFTTENQDMTAPPLEEYLTLGIPSSHTSTTCLYQRISLQAQSFFVIYFHSDLESSCIYSTVVQGPLVVFPILFP